MIPVYSGARYLERLAGDIEVIRNGWSVGTCPLVLAELVLVDDAAIDGSAEVIDRLSAAMNWIIPLHLSRNFGQHAATMAGILHSSGDWIVTMDEDLQHPPARIEDLIALAVKKRADVVYAKPSTGPHKRAWRDGSSKAFKLLMRWLTGNPNVQHFNSFRLIRGPVGRAAASLSGHDTYFDMSLSWFTERVDCLEMDLEDTRFRSSGKSGYSLRRLIRHASKMIYSSEIRFLGFGVAIGILLFLISVVGGTYFLLMRLISPGFIEVQGWTSLFLSICLASGLLAFMLGVVLKYLSTLVLNAHGKPAFFTIDRSRDSLLDAWLGDRCRDPQ